MNFIRIKILFFGLLLISCSVKKSQPQAVNPSPSSTPELAQKSEPEKNSPSLKIENSDWEFHEIPENRGLKGTFKRLRSEKLELIKQYFTVPELTNVSLSEANGFELYRVSKVDDLKNRILIHPKLFISTSSDQGSLLGYFTGQRSSRGEKVIAISVPMALVNGLVDSIPIIGGSANGVGSAPPSGGGFSGVISLPPQFRIPNIEALKAKIPNETIETLPVCPKRIQMQFRNRVYVADQPFKNVSICPINQFFRVSFEATETEMRELLENAALSDGAVNVGAELSAEFTVPKETYEIVLDHSILKTQIEANLSRFEGQEELIRGKSYLIQDIEFAIQEAVHSMGENANLQIEHSPGYQRFMDAIMDSFFEPPFQCETGGICRTLSKFSLKRIPLKYGWIQAETVASPLQVLSVSALGAVANSSEFISKPSISIFESLMRPKWFQGRSFGKIISECKEMNLESMPNFPGLNEPDWKQIVGYCRALNQNVSNEDDSGYYPLGANTTVYPGAWLKIDLHEISELTTAKTRTGTNGRVAIESEVIDLLAGDSVAKRTNCIEGNQTACEKYATRTELVRTPNGDPYMADYPCEEGSLGCQCLPPKEGQSEKRCIKKDLSYREIPDYECDEADRFSYCPYYRNEEVIISDEIEYECNDIKVDEYSSFLCMLGCYDGIEKQCKEKSRKPVKTSRQVLNCREDNPAGSAPRVNGCKRPKYLCEKWTERCSRYSVNEAFHIVHEEVAPKWRPFAIDQGEYPKRFEDQILLRFVSPKGTANDCRLDRFGRIFRGNTLFIKIPEADNLEQPCDSPLWNSENQKALFLPKVFIKNAISYPEERLCGRTEYSFLTKEIPIGGGRTVVPVEFTRTTQVTMGPVEKSCRADRSVRINSDLWFTENPPILIRGKVSVLGRVFESIVTQTKNNRNGLIR